MTNEKKFQQVKKEAAATGIFVFALIVFWLAAGFGLQGVSLRIFHLPVWVIAALGGTWFLAVLGVHGLTKYVFADMELEDDEHE